MLICEPSKSVKIKNTIEQKNINTLDSVTPVEDPVDFLSSEANDNSKSLNALNVVDIKPVTLFTIKNIHSGKIQKKPLMVLLDTGSERSVIKAAHSQHGNVTKGHTMKFRTPSGTFLSKNATDVEFTLNEFSESRRIRWKFHVLPEDSKLPYDMIIGRDLMRKLKMDVLYSDNVETWDDLLLKSVLS